MAVKLIEGETEPDVLDKTGRSPLRNAREKLYINLLKRYKKNGAVRYVDQQKVALRRRPWKL